MPSPKYRLGFDWQAQMARMVNEYISTGFISTEALLAYYNATLTPYRLAPDAAPEFQQQAIPPTGAYVAVAVNDDGIVWARECDFCAGTGTVQIKGDGASRDATCPDCNGTGRLELQGLRTTHFGEFAEAVDVKSVAAVATKL